MFLCHLYTGEVPGLKPGKDLLVSSCAEEVPLSKFMNICAIKKNELNANE